MAAYIDGDLLLDGHRLALALVERLDEPLAAGQRALGVRVEVGAELRERLEVADCDSSSFRRPATFFIGAIWASRRRATPRCRR